MSHRITRQSVIEARACYSDDKINRLIPTKGCTPKQVATARHIPLKDRYWALVNATGASYKTLLAHAIWCIKRRLPLVATLATADDYQKCLDVIKAVEQNKPFHLPLLPSLNADLVLAFKDLYRLLYLVEQYAVTRYAWYVGFAMSYAMKNLKGCKAQSKETRAQVDDMVKRLSKRGSIMRKITYNSLRKAGACYSDERLKRLVPKGGATPLQVAQARYIPLKDKLWVLYFASNASFDTLKEHAIWCIERFLNDEPDLKKYVDAVKAGTSVNYVIVNNKLQYAVYDLVRAVNEPALHLNHFYWVGEDIRQYCALTQEGKGFSYIRAHQKEMKAQVNDLAERLMKA